MKLNVNVYLPVRRPLRGMYSERGAEQVLKQRELFLSDLPRVMANGFYKVTEVSIPTLVEPTDEISALLIKLSPHGSLILCDIAHLTASVEFNVEELQRLNNRALDPDLYRSIAAHAVSEMVERALVLSEICYPGTVCSLDGICISEDSWQIIHAKSWYCALGEPDSNLPSWPPLEPISLVTVHRWAQKIGFGEEAIATTRISRMLAAYTHLIGLGQNNEGEVLFRAMQGLEAFFCDGVGDLRKQLADKIELWVGPIQDKKHSIGKLYEVRSKFVHGASYIDYYRHGMDIPEQEARSSLESEYASTFAVRLLIATIQNCIKRDVENILWKFEFDIRS